MIIQKTNNDTVKLYLVATPIGNYDDFTIRAIETLNKVDIIFCEDTRVTKVLLSHFGIKTKLSCYHIFNEDERSEEIIDMLKQGMNVALVSDAGMPCISDPGYLISAKAIEQGFDVVTIPGANAALTALAASGLPSDKFIFYGFLNHRDSQKKKELEKLRNIFITLIFHESALRIKSTLQLMYEVFGNRRVVVARELTKKFEEYRRGRLLELTLDELEYKGEIVIIVEGAKETQEQDTLKNLSIEEHFNYYIKKGIEEKEALKIVAKDRNISKSEVYNVIKVKEKK